MASNRQRHREYTNYAEDFEQIRRLGGGTFGEVFEARDRVDKLVYAVKRVNLSKLAGKSLTLAKQEADILMSIKHEHIVKMFTFFTGFLDEKLSLIESTYFNVTRNCH